MPARRAQPASARFKLVQPLSRLRGMNATPLYGPRDQTDHSRQGGIRSLNSSRRMIIRLDEAPIRGGTPPRARVAGFRRISINEKPIPR